MSKTKEYYKKNYVKIFDNIENPQWRIFKVIDKDGKCYQNKFQITSAKKLLKFINLTEDPQALYMSASTFLNPHRNHGFFYNQKVYDSDKRYHYPRAGYIFHDCVLLDSYLFIDFDSEDDLRVSQEDLRRVYNRLERMPFVSFEFAQFSGKKGLHLVYNFHHVKIENPIERINYFKQAKKDICKELLKLNLITLNKIHTSIVEDVFRVFAVPYSIKSNLNIVKPIPIDRLLNEDIYHILSESALLDLGDKTAREVKKTDDTKVAPGEVSTSPSTVSLCDERASLISRTFYFRYVDNMVNGLKNNYVTVIKKRNEDFNIRVIKKIQRMYNLSDFLVEKIGKYTYAYNTKLLQFSRLLKILRYAKSENFGWFVSRKHLAMQVSDSVDDEGKVVEKIELKYIIKSEFGQNDAHSKTHSKILGFNYNKMSGLENNRGTIRVKVMV